MHDAIPEGLKDVTDDKFLPQQLQIASEHSGTNRSLLT